MTGFIDRNFRLACINAIHCAGQLPNVFDDAGSQGLTDRLRALDNVVLTDELLSVITELAPDGGDDVYLFVDQEWGAENADLYISRFDDVLLLPNLASLWVHAVTTEGALDLSLLLKCALLRKVSADSFYITPSDENAAILARLEARGVDVEITWL